MKLFKPKNILITGGAGFIGANFIQYYSQQQPKTRIINLDKLTYAANRLALKVIVADNLIFIEGDICDTALVHSTLRNYEIDTIIHFAAESHVDRSITEPLLFAKTNVLGAVNLLDVARSYWLDELKLTEDQCRFYHISTDEVYGSLALTDDARCEDHIYQPRSPYSASKAASDHFVQAYYHTYGLPVVMSHCSNNYGPFQHSEKFIPTIIRACFNWQPITIYGNGANIRDWIYVEDHCRAIHAVLERGSLGESYNIAANNQVDNNRLAKEICGIMDELYPQKKSYASLMAYVTDRPGHDFRYALDTTKIKQTLNWCSHIDLAEGLRKTLAYYHKIWDPHFNENCFGEDTVI